MSNVPVEPLTRPGYQPPPGDPDANSKQFSQTIGERTETMPVVCLERWDPLGDNPNPQQVSQGFAPATDGCGWTGEVTVRITRVRVWNAGDTFPSHETEGIAYDHDMRCPNVLADGEVCGHPLTPVPTDETHVREARATRRDRMSHVRELEAEPKAKRG